MDEKEWNTLGADDYVTLQSLLYAIDNDIDIAISKTADPSKQAQYANRVPGFLREARHTGVIQLMPLFSAELDLEEKLCPEAEPLLYTLRNTHGLVKELLTEKIKLQCYPNRRITVYAKKELQILIDILTYIELKGNISYQRYREVLDIVYLIHA